MAETTLERNLTWLFLGIALALLAWPHLESADEAFRNNSEGWESAQAMGLALDLNERSPQGTSYYPTLDPGPLAEGASPRRDLLRPAVNAILNHQVMRAAGQSGPRELRIPATVFTLAFAFVLFLLLSRHFRSTSALVGVVAIGATPYFALLARLGDGSAAMLFFSIAGIELLARHLKKGSMLALVASGMAFILASHFSWAGLAAPLISGGIVGIVQRNHRVALAMFLVLAGSLGAQALHVSWASDASFWHAVSRAVADAGPKLWLETAFFKELWIHHSFGLGVIAIVATVAALLVAVGTRSRRAWIRPFLFLLLTGALGVFILTIIGRPSKFAGIMWLPLVAFALAAVFEVVIHAGKKPLETRAVQLLAFVVMGLSIWFAHRQATAVEHSPDGGEHVLIAEALEGLITEQDRGLILTDQANYSGDLLTTHLRTRVLAAPGLGAETLLLLRTRVREEFASLRGRRVLLYLPGDRSEEPRASLVALALKVGRAYDFDIDPHFFDLTAFVWND